MPVLIDVPGAVSAARAQAETPCHLSFETIDGFNPIDLNVWGHMALADAQGLLGGDPEWVYTKRAGMRGARPTDVDQPPHETRLPIRLRPESGDWREVVATINRLRTYFADELVDWRRTEAAFWLVAHSAGKVRRIGSLYAGGLSDVTVGDPGTQRLPLILTHPDPDWVGDEWRIPEPVRLSDVGPWTSDDPAHPWPRATAPSSAIGAPTTITVGGDRPSHPVLQVVGPTSGLRFTSVPQRPHWPSMDFRVGPVPEGSTLVVDTSSRRKTVTLDGVPAPQMLLGPRRWGAGILWGIPFTYTVDLDGATLGTSFDMWGRERWRSWR